MARGTNYIKQLKAVRDGKYSRGDEEGMLRWSLDSFECDYLLGRIDRCEDETLLEFFNEELR